MRRRSRVFVDGRHKLDVPEEVAANAAVMTLLLALTCVDRDREIIEACIDSVRKHADWRESFDVIEAALNEARVWVTGQ